MAVTKEQAKSRRKNGGENNLSTATRPLACGARTTQRMLTKRNRPISILLVQGIVRIQRSIERIFRAVWLVGSVPSKERGAVTERVGL